MKPFIYKVKYKPADDKKNDKKSFADKFQQEFIKDVNAREPMHQKNNFHYLNYKGILYLNNIYGQDYLKTIGMQVHVPRTFMTIETIRSRLSVRPLDIEVESMNFKEHKNAVKARDMLRGEWKRSNADWAKVDMTSDGLLFGTGFGISRYREIMVDTDLYKGTDKEGEIIRERGETTHFKGMTLNHLNPYHVFPDRNATTDEPYQPGSWRHCFVYSLWDFDVWKGVCKANGFNVEGMEKGGILREFDQVRRRIDDIYSLSSNYSIRTRDGGQLVSQSPERDGMDMENTIMVVEKFEPNRYSIVSGANWTVNHNDTNPNADKIIPIHVIRDYQVQGEFDGIGEAEAIRWQQYEENKVHNLAYMQILMQTVQRYGIVEDLLKDPTEASFTNPFKPIRIKRVQGVGINDAIQKLDQAKGNGDTFKFLDIIKQVGQGTTGISDYLIASSESAAGTLGEADMMRQAGNQRILDKIYRIEERDLTKILSHWLVNIPQYYDEELDLLINDETNYHIKYLPYDRQFNDHIPTVVDVGAEEGVLGKRSLEEIYLSLGYEQVVFVSDIIGKYNVIIKTASGDIDNREKIKDYMEALTKFMELNKMGASFNIAKLGEELLRQFPDIIKNVEEYKMQTPAVPQVGDQVNPEKPGGVTENLPINPQLENTPQLNL